MPSSSVLHKTLIEVVTEFSKLHNPELDGLVAIDQLMAFLKADLLQQFALQTVDSDVLDLDSTTDSKFSRHIILRNCVFQNTNEMGRYVRYLYGKAAMLHNQGNPQVSSLFPKVSLPLAVLLT